MTDRLAFPFHRDASAPGLRAATPVHPPDRRSKEHLMNRFFTRRPFAWFVAVLGLFALTASAQAAKRPYAARGTAQFVSETEFVGVGNATHLGRYDEAGSALFTPTRDPAIVLVTAWITYTAAN